MSDPYKVLGVSRDATDDEIKKAYRQLSRKYHPDANINNPNKDKAEEMFKLVQQAYDQIMDERKNGGARYGGYGNSGNSHGDFGGFGGWGDFGGFGGFGGQQSHTHESQSDAYLRAAANYINNGHYSEALNVLGQVAERTSKWYYYSAIANNGVGNNIIALDHARTALNMEPNNYQYQRLVQTLESGGQWYSDRQQSYGGINVTPCCSNPCLTLCLLNTFCPFCCRF